MVRQGWLPGQGLVGRGAARSGIGKQPFRQVSTEKDQDALQRRVLILFEVSQAPFPVC